MKQNIYFFVPNPISEDVLKYVVQDQKTARVSNDSTEAIVKLPNGVEDIPECLKSFLPLNIEGVDYVIKNNPEKWQQTEDS
jgi:hypothetical protein